MASPEAHRTFYAELITSSVGMPRSRLTSAFMATPREHYLGPGPWKVFTVRGYIQTPSACRILYVLAAQAPGATTRAATIRDTATLAMNLDFSCRMELHSFSRDC
jgi:hypothetical protein